MAAVKRQIEAVPHVSEWFDLSDWHAADRFQGEPPRREMLVEGVFPLGKASLVAAAGGVGKSFSLLELAREVAAGLDTYPRPMLFGGVLQAAGAAVLVTSEDDSIEVHASLFSMGEIPPRLYVVSLPDAGGVRPLFQADRAGVVAATPAWDELARQLNLESSVEGAGNAQHRGLGAPHELGSLSHRQAVRALWLAGMP